MSKYGAGRAKAHREARKKFLRWEREMKQRGKKMGSVADRIGEFLKSGNWKAKPTVGEDSPEEIPSNDESCVNSQIDKLKAQRMVLGEKKHGVLCLETDPRDFIDEGVQELIDCLNYLQLSMEQGKINLCKWFSLDRDIRFIVWRLWRADSMPQV